MKSAFFAFAVAALLIIAQVSAYSVICEEHFIPQKDVSCNDFGTGKAGYLLRIKDLIIMNPLINCSNTNKKIIKKGTKICVLPNFDVENDTIKKAKISNSKVTCKDVTNYAGLKENQAYILENMNKNILVCSNIQNQAGNVIEVCKDKNYNPDFSNSKIVYETNY